MTANPTATVFGQSRGTATQRQECIAGFQRAGMLDWPGKVAATVFLAGCTMRCPYCHNPELLGSVGRGESLAAVLEHVRARRDWLDGVVVTGGEALAHPDVFDVLAALKAEGAAIKIDTNGTRPDALEKAIANGLVDFVALDIKATPERYDRACGVSGAWDAVSRSLALILDSGIDHEFRTTCYPLAVGPDDLVHIAALLVGGRRYVLQQFRAQRTLDPAAVSVRPHLPDTLRRAASRCSLFVPTFVRGV